MKKILVIFFILAFLEKTIWDLGPNVELITTAAILSAYYLGGKNTFIITLITLIISDLIIGNTNIFLFTWTGFLIPVLLSSNILNNIISRVKIKTISLTITGLTFNLFFFFWTNFGVWLLDSWGMYTNDPNGLIRCYINGLPFLKNQLVSTIVFIPIGYLLTKALIHLTRQSILQPGLARKTLL